MCGRPVPPVPTFKKEENKLPGELEIEEFEGFLQSKKKKNPEFHFDLLCILSIIS